jgi:hypothetical protein
MIYLIICRLILNLSNFFSVIIVEPTMGFEPMTSSLPRKCSTPELRRLMF